MTKELKGLFPDAVRDEYATRVLDVIVREVGILSHVESRVVEPILAIIEGAYEAGMGAMVEAINNGI